MTQEEEVNRTAALTDGSSRLGGCPRCGSVFGHLSGYPCDRDGDRLKSTFWTLCQVQFPAFQGRQNYMHTFNTRDFVMASGYEDYQEIVRDLCQSARYDGVAHMTVDEKIVGAGMSQRRPGAHVDGRFSSERGAWLHLCNNIALSPIPRMAIIVAASEPGCIVYPGIFDGSPRSDGDLEHIRPQFKQAVTLEGNRGYLFSPDCVHESVRFAVPLQRSFLRIALERFD